jgi:hypothetical protein
MWIWVIEAGLGMAGYGGIKATLKYIATGQKPGDKGGKKK